MEALDQMLRCSWPWLATVDEATAAQDATDGAEVARDHGEYSSVVHRVGERRGAMEADALHRLLVAARASGQEEAVGDSRVEELLELRQVHIVQALHRRWRVAHETGLWISQVGGRQAANDGAAAWLARAMEVADLAAGERAAVFQELQAQPEQLQRILSNVRATSLATAALMPSSAVAEGNPLAYAFRALMSGRKQQGSN